MKRFTLRDEAFVSSKMTVLTNEDGVVGLAFQVKAHHGGELLLVSSAASLLACYLIFGWGGMPILTFLVLGLAVGFYLEAARCKRVMVRWANKEPSEGLIKLLSDAEESLSELGIVLEPRGQIKSVSDILERVNQANQQIKRQGKGGHATDKGAEEALHS